MSLTEEQRNNYLTDGGNKCPHCGSDNIEGGSVQIDSNIAWQEIICGDCGADWTDLYKLFDVQD